MKLVFCAKGQTDHIYKLIQNKTQLVLMSCINFFFFFATLTVEFTDTILHGKREPLFSIQNRQSVSVCNPL